MACHVDAELAARAAVTYLVQNGVLCRVFGDWHGLLENAAVLVELHGLVPVVEGAGDEDLFGGMWPISRVRVSQLNGKDCSALIRGDANSCGCAPL